MAERGSARIRPGSRREIGLVNAGIVWVLGLATGGRPPNVFTTLARHHGLFRRWLWFAGALMPGGKLLRAETAPASSACAEDERRPRPHRPGRLRVDSAA